MRLLKTRVVTDPKELRRLGPRTRWLWLQDGPVTFLGKGWILLYGEELQRIQRRPRR